MVRVMEQNGLRGASVAESAARHLKELIVEGALNPGDLLLSERDLAQQLNVSRPTLRQGIRMLEEEGLIVATSSGRSIAPLGRDIADPLIALIASLGGTVESFYFGFGSDDFYVTVDLPGNTAAAAGAMTVAAAGGASARTVVLLTPEEVDAAMKLSPSYRAPGA